LTEQLTPTVRIKYEVLGLGSGVKYEGFVADIFMGNLTFS
jgi:hypothetical protein